MKMNYLILALTLLGGLTSCNKDMVEAPKPITKSNIIGSVNLYDEGVTQIDNSNMMVKVAGTSPLVSTTTDVNGDFILSDVPFGTYILVYEKSGYGTFKKFQVEHTNTESATTISETPSLGESSTTQVTDLTVNTIGNDVTLSITTNPAGNNGNTRYVRYFLSTDANVSDENYIFYSPGLISRINPKDLTLSKNDLISAGFSSGQTVFAKVYGDSFWSNEYDDPDLGRRIFPNLNRTSSNSVSFIVP